MDGHKNEINMSEQASFDNRIDLEQLRENVQALKAEAGKIIIGQERMIELMITAILADGHVLLEGVPGVAKTLASKVISKLISVDFSRIQFTPDLMPSDVLGTSIFNMKSSEFEFKKGPIFSNIVLIDEINRSPAKTQAALFEVMEEHQVTMDGTTYPMSEPYLVIATQNPIEQEGTYRLPEAQLDRFLFKIEVGYPSTEEETSMLVNHHQQRRHDLEKISPVLTATDIIKYREQVQQVKVEEHLFKYIAELTQGTRQHSGLYLGASPRASVAILHSAKAYAAVNGRDFVTPEDIKSMATPVLRHRVILSPEKEMEGTTAEDLIKQIIDKVEVPR